MARHSMAVKHTHTCSRGCGSAAGGVLCGSGLAHAGPTTEKRTAEVIEAIEQGVIGVNHQYIHSGLDTPLIWATITDNVELVQVRPARFPCSALLARARVCVCVL